MATSMVGTLTAFDGQTQAWEEYCEMLDHFFEANGIADEARKRAILLSSVGGKTYSLMRNLLSPDKPGAKSYKDLMDLLQSHYNLKPSEIVQRFKFNSRIRAATETVSEYVAVLRELAQHCNYGEKLKEMLCDRLVCGIADDHIQRRLLAEPELTFDKALAVAQAMETANRDVHDLQLQSMALAGTIGKDTSPLSVHKVNMGQGKAASVVCYRCGGDHWARNCRGINDKCYGCGKKGHVKKMCKSSAPIGKQQFMGGGRHKNVDSESRKEKRQSTHHMSESPDTQASNDEVFTMHNLEDSEITKVDPITTQLEINGKIVDFEVDTGCGVTIMTKSECGKLWTTGNAQELQDCSWTLKT
ncbi:uncharacterized protein LOC125739899 [Brienomyrus brachyistius]|uniref:uncharacterized protein LOC125739899 n=1 Tax=Brienomyrus brachyistius TaxID=42636 RepID=UPI0020B18539|nr:uncharacterized protein LOC125739899 [Brienomyrus brachyistius]